MSTPLTKSIVRTLSHEGADYKLVVSTSGIRLSRKGRQLGVDFTWAQLLAERTTGATTSPAPSAPQLGMEALVAADVLVLMQRARDALGDAATLIDGASDIPASIARHREPAIPSERERADWYIERLLTPAEVAKVLGVSTRMLRGLPLVTIKLGSHVRYRPADFRLYLATLAKEDKDRRNAIDEARNRGYRGLRAHRNR